MTRRGAEAPSIIARPGSLVLAGRGRRGRGRWARAARSSPRAARAPVRDVVLGEAARLLDVAHLRRGAAAAPLLAHEAELDSRVLQEERDRPRDRGAVERGLAVAEEDRLAADGQVEAGRPV